MAKRGIESYIDYLYKRDYSEVPVSIETMMSSPEFFGSLTQQGRAIYPIWREKLTEIMGENSKWLIALTGAIGVGKSRSAIQGIAHGMHQVCCLRDAHEYFNLMKGRKFAVVFFNLTKSLSESSGYKILQQYLLASPWFRSKGTVVGNPPNERLELPLFEYRIASPAARGFSTQGVDVLFALMDEVDSPTVSEKQKIKVLVAFDETVRRFESRFVDDIHKETLGKFFLVASKQEELSFLNTFIEERKNTKSLYVVDIPYWAIKNKNELSGKTFKVMLGDAYTPSKLIDYPEDEKVALKAGLELIEVPVEYREDFERDLQGSLKDIAGRSVAEMRKSKLFPSAKVILDCYDENKPDPAKVTTAICGLNDNLDLIKFLDLSKIRIPKNIPRFIHEDIAYSGDGDALSVAMSCVKDWVYADVENEDGSFEGKKVPVVETDFVIRFKARPGDEVPLYKVRKFVLDLRKAGFNIKRFTADLALLSADTKQILERSGIECDYLSVDKDVKPYLAFKDLVNEGRWICHKNNLLHFELVNLEYDKAKQKIDHPHKIPTIEFLSDGSTKEVVMLGTKDAADSVAGSTWSVLQASPAVPVTAQQIKRLAEARKKPIIDSEDPFNFMQNSIRASGGFEQYQLVDSKSLFYIWSRNGTGHAPELTGPFKEKMLNLQVIQVSNPVEFSPVDNTKGVELSKNTKGFIDVLKAVKRMR